MATLPMKFSNMFSFSFKNRIAFYYLLSTALIVFIVFLLIYFVVSASVTFDVNNDIDLEIKKHQDEVTFVADSLKLFYDDEWREREHTELSVNPIFVEIYNKQGKLIDKSPNLKSWNLKLLAGKHSHYHDTLLGNFHIRQAQAVLATDGKTVGYVVIAMSMEQPIRVVDNLLITLMIAFPLVLIALFAASRFIAGKSIRPALEIIETTSRITNNNFDDRIKLPVNKDELFTLSESINSLLDRIESAINREKQFTSDASHELRTPLAVVKGTLEVLIRKPRDSNEYRDKIEYCISEIDRLNNLVDQLLLLARFENQKIGVQNSTIALDEIILESLQRFSPVIESNKLSIEFTFKEHFYVASDAYLVSIIIENLLSNALKYSNPGGLVRIVLQKLDGQISCQIIDKGIGIAKSELDKIYGQFYRVDATSHPGIKGNGLGLSIVRRLCDLLGVKMEISSEVGEGTNATLIFSKI